MLPPLSAAKFVWWDCKNCLASHSIWSQPKLLLHSSVGVHGLFKSHLFKEGKPNASLFCLEFENFTFTIDKSHRRIIFYSINSNYNFLGKNQIQMKPVTNKVSCYEKFKHPCNQKYGGQKPNKGNMFVIKSMQSDEGKCFALSESKLSTQKKKNIHKKRQKIRMLNDIMEKEILETARKTPSCDKQGFCVKIPPKNDFCSKSNVFKVQKDNNGKSPKENIKGMKNKKKWRESEIQEVEEFPLIQLTSRTSEKAKVIGIADSERKLDEHVVLPVKSAEPIVPKILMDITKTDKKGKKEVVINQGKKQDGVLEGEFGTNGKNMVVDKDNTEKSDDHIITLTKSAKSVLGKRVMNSELTAFHDRLHKKGKTSKKQYKDAKCYPIQGSKV